MRSPPSLSSQRSLHLLRTLVSQRARQHLAEARQREDAMKSQIREQSTVVDASYAAWATYLGSRLVEPDHLARLGVALTQQADELERLEKARQRAVLETEQSENQLATTDAHVRLSERSLKRAQKFAAGATEDRVDRLTEDHVSFLWSAS